MRILEHIDASGAHSSARGKQDPAQGATLPGMTGTTCAAGNHAHARHAHMPAYSSQVEWTAAEIKKQRLLRGWEQTEAAAKLGVGRRTLSSWETGEASPQLTGRAALNRVYGPPGETVILTRADDMQLLEEFMRRIRQRGGHSVEAMRLVADLAHLLAASSPHLPDRDLEWPRRTPNHNSGNEPHPGHADSGGA